ncbi:MAG: MFS transporter [Anaerolineaceae bacterium]|jgi:MFS family permease
MKTISRLFDRVFNIRPEDNVPEDVAVNFKHNVVINTLDLSLFFFSDSFWSINTILPVFAATLTDNPFLIGLIPAVINAGSSIPQVFMSGRVSKQSKVLPITMKLGFLERLPYMFMPLLALLIGKVEDQVVFGLFFLLMVWRGIGSGLIGLPWQELNARVIPISHRARYIGFSRVAGQITGVVGSLISVYLLGKYAYPTNYAIGFTVASVGLWLSYAALSRNREPEFRVRAHQETGTLQTEPGTWQLMKQVLKTDGNFRRYLVARSLGFIGNMASAFIAVYALERFNLGDEQAAIFTAIILITGIIGYVVWGSLGDRIGPQKAVILSFAAWGLGLLVAIFSQSIWVYYSVFALFGLYLSGVNLGDTMLIMELGDERLRPTYLGMARSLTGASLLLAPVLSGWLLQSFSYVVMFAVSLAFMLLSTVIMATVKDRPRRPLV